MTLEASTQVNIKILEKEYQISCPVSERVALLNSAELLNAKMREIRDSGKVIGLDRMLQPQQQTENEYAEHRWLRSIKKGLLRLIAADTLPPVNRNSFWPAFGGCFAGYEWSVAARTA